MQRLPVKSTLVPLVAALALALAGCTTASDDQTSESASHETVAPSETAPEATGSPTVVTVHEMEFSIELDQEVTEPGLYTFQILNEGVVGHNFSIAGPGIDGVVSSNLESGAMQSITVTLQTGRYEIWCSIGSHKQNGMYLFFDVG